MESSGIVLFKNFYEERNDLEGEVTEEAIVLIVSGDTLPLVVESAQKILAAAAEDFSAKVDIAKATLKDHKGEMLFVTVNPDEEYHKSFVEFFGLDKLPSMRVVKLEEDVSKFKPESTELSKENMHAFMKRRPSCSNLEPARARPPEQGQLGSALRISGKEL